MLLFAKSRLIKVFFKNEKNVSPELIYPEEGQNKSILKMAEENAYQDIMKRKRTVRNEAGLTRLMEVLGLGKLPRRIEGFDIAQLSGKYTVASLISFRDGNPDKANYRRFNIRSLEGKIDEYDVEIQLVISADQSVRGSYFYKKNGKNLPFRGRVSGDGRIKLEVYDITTKVVEYFKGQLKSAATYARLKSIDVDGDAKLRSASSVRRKKRRVPTCDARRNMNVTVCQ